MTQRGALPYLQCFFRYFVSVARARVELACPEARRFEGRVYTDSTIWPSAVILSFQVVGIGFEPMTSGL